MTPLIHYLLHPIPWLVMGFFIVGWRRWSKGLRRGLTVVYLAVCYATTTPWLPLQLAAHLEDQYPPIALASLDTAQVYHIIVLGAGHEYDDRLPATNLLSLTALGRLAEGLRLYRQLPHSRLITSGHSASGRQTQAEVMREAAILLGADPARVYAQGEPANTRQEAVTYAHRFGTDTPLIICTSATHMPRAIAWFRQQGVEPLAAPTNHLVKRQNQSTWRSILPRTRYWDILAELIHEYVGMWQV